MGYKNGTVLKTAFQAYTVQGQQGSGGSGTVYAVTNEEGSSFAAKILDQTNVSRTRLRRFQKEIDFCTKMDHPNIVRVLDYGVTAKGETFYIMPLYSGTLRSLISTGIPADRVLPYFGQVLD